MLQGTKIQAVIFDSVIDLFKNTFKYHKTYEISNGIIKPVNQGYSNIHPDIELHLLSNTDVKKFDVDLSTTNITLNFMTFEKAT